MANDEVRGRTSSGNAAVEAAHVTRSSKSGYYTGLSTTIPDAASDTVFTALTGASTFFTPLPDSRANWMEIYSDQNITVKFKTRQNQATTVGNLKSVKIRANTTKVISWLAEITELYVSNASGSTANIDLLAI